MDSLLAWVGGKRQLRRQIAQMIPKKIKGYIEPFGGAAWVLFFKDRWASLEVYNDIDSRLTNLFIITKYHPEALIKELEFMIASRELFKELVKQKGLTDVQRAARFYYIIKRSFGSKGEHFGVSCKGGGAAFGSQTNLIRRVREIHKRLDKVVIENLDYKEIFKIYDDKENFFFLDPPYRFGAQYKSGKLDYIEFLKELQKLKGKFLLTIDDCPENRKLFSEFAIKKVARITGINRKQIKNNLFKELIIKNY